MIRVRSVVNLTHALQVWRSVKEETFPGEVMTALEIKPYPRGRKLFITLTVTARDKDDNPVGKEVYTATFKLEPIGTSSSRSGYDRWLVYVDEWEGKLSVAPSTSDRYTRPDKDKVRRLLRQWITQFEWHLSFPGKIRYKEPSSS